MLIIYIKHLAGIMGAKTISRAKNSSHAGFTIVELMIVIVISLLLVGVIVSFILGVTDQFAVSAVRGQMNAQVTSATNRLENDIRYARSILAENSVTDGAAPSNDNRWNSGPDQLVIGATARNSSNAILGANYTDKLDNYIYYLKNGTLYRRLLAYPDSNNRYSTATCTQTTSGGCASDTAILPNVDSLEFIYYDNDGNVTSDFDQVTNVKANITTKTRQSRHDIELSNSASFRLAMTASSDATIPGIPSLQGTINAGYGGISVGFSSSFDIDGDVSTLGNFTITSGSNVKVNNIYASHLNCGPTNQRYGTLCPASPAPILTDYGSNIRLTADSACAPAPPVVAAKSTSAAVISIGNITTSCDLPSTLPVFDKQALVGSIPPENTSTGTLNCFGGNSGRTFEFPGNHRHVGDLDFGGGSCNARVTSGGVLYIDGSLTIGWGSYLEVDPSVTEPVTVVVNGRIIIYNGRLGNSGVPKLNLISFHSINETCSRSTSCNALGMKDLYDTVNSFVHGMLIHHSATNVYANFYAPFSTIRFSTSPKIETNEIYGQKVDLDFGHLGQLTLAP